MSRNLEIQCQGKSFSVIYDDVDDSLVSQYRWHIQDPNLPYVSTNLSKKPSRKGYLHRMILNVQPKVFVDHRDRNPLNNVRLNLRACSRAENLRNSCARKRNKSGFKGVYQCSRTKRWVARIHHLGVTYWLGRFPTKEDAALAYNAKAQLLFGEFAFQNTL